MSDDKALQQRLEEAETTIQELMLERRATSERHGRALEEAFAAGRRASDAMRNAEAPLPPPATDTMSEEHRKDLADVQRFSAMARRFMDMLDEEQVLLRQRLRRIRKARRLILQGERPP